MDGLGALASVKIHRKVGTRGAFFALLSCLPLRKLSLRQAGWASKK
jgi:hypothetical protein